MLKAELIKQAYSEIRISGITSEAVPEDVEIALHELDNLMWVWDAMGRDVNYNFPAPTPGNELRISDPNEDAQIELWSQQGVVTSLAIALVNHFGKEVPEALTRKRAFAVNVIKQRTVKLDSQPYPNRMPIGAGQRLRYTGQLRRFYHPNYKGRGPFTVIASDTNLDMTADFTRDLGEGDAISTYEIEATGGIRLESNSRNGNVVSYRVAAGSDPLKEGLVKVTVLTENELLLTQTHCFDVAEASCA